MSTFHRVCNTLLILLVLVVAVVMFVRMDQRLQRTEAELRNMTRQFHAMRDRVYDLETADYPDPETETLRLKQLLESYSKTLMGKLQTGKVYIRDNDNVRFSIILLNVPGQLRNLKKLVFLKVIIFQKIICICLRFRVRVMIIVMRVEKMMAY